MVRNSGCKPFEVAKVIGNSGCKPFKVAKVVENSGCIPFQVLFVLKVSTSCPPLLRSSLLRNTDWKMKKQVNPQVKRETKRETIKLSNKPTIVERNKYKYIFNSRFLKNTGWEMYL